jgi:general L-amino acid transport system permease protein
MADISPQLPSTEEESIPFWRDGRVIGVIAQIIFLTLVILGVTWLARNVSQNLSDLGIGCPDGSIQFGCLFDFLRLDAAFDISETLVDYDPSDAYRQALLVGLLNTIRVTVLGIILATILGTLAGIARLSDNWLVSSISSWYVDLFRNTPLLLQLFFIFFGVLLVLPNFQEAIQPLGLPIYFSQRGINMPWPVALPSFAIWLAFIVAAIVQAQVIWVILGRREERTGKESNRALWVVLLSVLLIGAGWFVATASANNYSLMAHQSLRIREFDDIEGLMLRRLSISNLEEIDLEIATGDLTVEEVEAAALTICAVRDDPAETNLTAQLNNANIPHAVNRSNRVEQATEVYIAGECETYVAGSATLAGERTLLGESAAANHIIPVPETPMRISVPRIEGLNFVGGLKLSPNFAAILIGLVLYTGAFIAEIVRAGIQSVSKGQSEAARALGLSESQRLRLVVLPQALRVIIPPLTSQYLNLAKNSSLAIAVGYPDLWSVAFTTLNQSGQAIQVFLIVMGLYLTLSLSISFLLNLYNQRIALVER